MKTAIVLLNLGGPDSKEAIKPFLMNFFTDKNIVRLPYPLRYLIAKSIAKNRSKHEAGESYGLLGNKSPLLENSLLQAQALTEKLNETPDHEYRIFISMRYWHPMADETAQQVKDFNPDNIILLPLYPQYSTTTTRSSLQTWRKACKKIGLSKPESTLCCYPWEDGFIKASADKLAIIYKQAEKECGVKPRVLFSAHGLPEDIVKDGDPYEWQCETSAEKIAAATGIDYMDWQICYQSRIGRKKWLSPSTEEALQQAITDNVPVVILPHAFTQEHVETLVEIELEYREIAEKNNIKGFYRVDTVGTHEDYIKGLYNMVKSAERRDGIASSTGARLCPQEFCRCAMDAKNGI